MLETRAISMNRRHFIGATAAAAVAMAAKPVFSQITPNSNFNGVQIGAITYSFRSLPGSAADILKYVTQCGISSIELMDGPAEEFAGRTMERLRPPRGEHVTDKQKTEFAKKRQAQAEEMKAWRKSVSMSKYEALKKMYNDAGVNIHIIKFGGIGEMSDDEVHYCFEVARTLGAQGITTEISVDKARRLGPFADEHNIMLGFHNHTQVNAESYDEPLSFGKYLAINLDIGHYVAGTNESPLPLIEKYGDAGRILSLHIKDRKVNNGANMPLGQGDTPLALALHLMKKNGYTFPADIELEYQVPENSDAVKEVTKCVEFCKNVLA